ncbi:S-type pyocin [Serratia fonticola]|uniref:S-type pyocin n=1 Tax=Serratia fonticola TaxID=47917 RepID=A0A542D8Q9_SERFO|nr:S-type pyocin domain-containing protein [Serratia fonticola]TQI78526.1 S-type pyocin [Serratia fonticola]TQI99451.1 S-type pyocin [Serratia fonticola]TVZ68975.1 S-type pyocin [Serratia fonticola]
MNEKNYNNGIPPQPGLIWDGGGWGWPTSLDSHSTDDTMILFPSINSSANSIAYYKDGVAYNTAGEAIITITNGPTPPTGTIPSSPPSGGGLFVSMLPSNVAPVYLKNRLQVDYIPGKGPKFTPYNQLIQLQKIFDDQISAARAHIIEPAAQIIERAFASLQRATDTQTGDDSRVSSAGASLDAAVKGLQDANNEVLVSEVNAIHRHDAAEKALKEVIPILGLTNVSPNEYDFVLTRILDSVSRSYWEEKSVKPRVEEYNAKQRLLAALDNIAVIIDDVVSKSNTLTTVVNQVKNEREASAKLAALMAAAGVNPTPVYTQEMVKSAQASLVAAGGMVLNRAPGMLQLTVAAEGVLTTASELAGTVAGALWRGAAELSRIATVSTLGATVGTLVIGFWPKEVGLGSDQILGRDMDLFAAQALLFAAGKVSMTPEMASVNLPVRGLLVTEDGRQYVALVKTGIAGVSANVPVLKAVRDEKTGLDKITLPAVAGTPSRTILINPVPVGPTAPANTGNSSPAPVTPVHTGTTIKQADSIVTTTFPAEDLKGLRDFIYWQPSAEETGVEAIYVMLSNPYGNSNSKGKYSGRDYHTEKAGGPIQDLDWKTAKVDRAGVDKVKLHTGRFEESADNKVMIDRLEKILKGELTATDIDKRFYTHEIRELERYRALGVPDGITDDSVWNNAHTATLEDYKINEKSQPLYTPEAEEAYRKAEEGM